MSKNKAVLSPTGGIIQVSHSLARISQKQNNMGFNPMG
jgi:hypothetical protein